MPVAMVSFADYKKSNALEAKKKAHEAEEITKLQKAAKSTTVSARRHHFIVNITNAITDWHLQWYRITGWKQFS
jgi:hypothetical protein